MKNITLDELGSVLDKVPNLTTVDACFKNEFIGNTDRLFHLEGQVLDIIVINTITWHYIMSFNKDPLTEDVIKSLHTDMIVAEIQSKINKTKKISIFVTHSFPQGSFLFVSENKNFTLLLNTEKK